MNALQRADSVVLVGEIVNEDTVPAYVNVGCDFAGPGQQRDGAGKQLRQNFSHAAAKAGFAVSH